MIFIDPPMWPAHNTLFSHLVSDTSLDELHSFARGAGISPRAFDGDHYDVPQHLHRELVRRGAVPVTGGQLVRILIGSGLRIPARERPSALAAPLLERWNRLVPGRPELGAQLLARWNEPHRRYHDRRHLLQVLEALDLLTGGSVPRPVALAAWFHDAVYACRPGADEEASAGLAEELLSAAGEDPAAVAECARLVRLTAAHTPDSGDRHGALLVDADLSVLARDPARYRSYVQSVRAEYAHLSEAEFRTGRRRVLARLGAAEPLFRTEAGRLHWDARARRNLAGELAELADLADPADPADQADQAELSGQPAPGGPGSGDRP